MEGLNFFGPASVTPEAKELCKDKHQTKLHTSGVIASPEGYVIGKTEKPERKLPFPLVVKPLTGSLARGVFVKLETNQEFFAAVEHVQKLNFDCLVEEYIEGTKWRILASKYSHISNLVYSESYVIGNGRSRLKDLVDMRSNRTGMRIKIDKNALEKQRLNEYSIIHEGRKVTLSYIAALASGASCTERGDIEGFDIASRVIQSIPTLVTAGVDIIQTEDKWYLLEVNAHSYLRQHLAPNKGTAQPVVSRIVDAYIQSL